MQNEVEHHELSYVSENEDQQSDNEIQEESVNELQEQSEDESGLMPGGCQYSLERGSYPSEARRHEAKREGG